MEYTVTAWSYSLGEDGVWGPNVYSEASEPQRVTIPDTSGINEAFTAGETPRVSAAGGMLRVETAEDAVLELYNATGMLIGRYDVSAGTNTIAAPCRGLIIARMGGFSAKTVVK